MPSGSNSATKVYWYCLAPQKKCLKGDPEKVFFILRRPKLLSEKKGITFGAAAICANALTPTTKPKLSPSTYSLCFHFSKVETKQGDLGGMECIYPFLSDWRKDDISLLHSHKRPPRELSPWTSGPESLLSFRTWLQILGLIWYSESLWLYSPGFCRRYPTGLLSFEFFCDFSVLREKTKAHKSSNDSRLTKLTAILAIVQIFSPDLRL